MSARERRKGAAGELEVIELLKASGWSVARRNFASGASGGGDVAGGPGGVHVEIKRQERLNVHKAMAQAIAAAHPTEVPIVAHRRSRGDWLATLPLVDLLELLALRERG